MSDPWTSGQSCTLNAVRSAPKSYESTSLVHGRVHGARELCGRHRSSSPSPHAVPSRPCRRVGGENVIG